MPKLKWPQIVFYVVAAAAPLTGMLGAVPPAISLGNGAGVPGAYLVVGVMLLLFSVGFAAMSRHVVNGGAFYAYIAQGLGRPSGVGAALVALVSYTAIQIALYGLFGFFCADVIGGPLQLGWPWFVYSILALIIILFLGIRNVETNSRIVFLLMSLEIGILVMLSSAILAKGGGPEGLSAKPFMITEVFSGHPGIAIMFALASFIGFEATAVYGEESEDPRRAVPLATYASVLLIMTLFAIVTWTIVCAYGPDNVVAAATSDPGHFWFNQSEHFLGYWPTFAMSALLLTSVFASLLAFHSTISRYMHALALDRFLPASLGAVHARFASPHIASYVQTASAAVILLAFIVAQADPYAIIFSWASAFGTIGVISLLVLVSVSVTTFFRRTRLDKRLWNTMVAPGLGGLALCYALGLLVENLPTLSGTESAALFVMSWAMLAVFVAGMLASVVMRSLRPEAYEKFAGLSVVDPSTLEIETLEIKTSS
jgi:amino acid transporter